MPDSQRQTTNAQTHCLDFSELVYETIEATGGRAVAIRFRLPDQEVRIGDALVVLDGSDIRFHAIISRVAEGWGVAADPRGSSIPSGTVS